jgi:hypothetical protein
LRRPLIIIGVTLSALGCAAASQDDRPSLPEGSGDLIEVGGLRFLVPSGMARLAAPEGVIGLGPPETPVPVPRGVEAVFLTPLRFEVPLSPNPAACAALLLQGAQGAEAGDLETPSSVEAARGLAACETEGRARGSVVYVAFLYDSSRGVLVVGSAAPRERAPFLARMRSLTRSIEFLAEEPSD